MHVNYQWVLHFYHCLVILLVEQLEVDSSLNDHKVYIFTYIYIFFFLQQQGLTEEKSQRQKSTKV